jgi:hypothetical protein
LELKKLRAQQRKAAKKAEQEKQEKLLQQQREQREREQREREQRDPHSHHQKRNHNQQDKEADAPPVDDLQPQKLARVRLFFICVFLFHPTSFVFVFLNYRLKTHSIRPSNSCSHCRNGALIILKSIYWLSKFI